VQSQRSTTSSVATAGGFAAGQISLEDLENTFNENSPFKLKHI